MPPLPLMQIADDALGFVLALDSSRHETSQDIEYDISVMEAVAKRFSTGGFHRGQTVSQHRVEDVDHLPSSVLASLRRVRSIAAGSTQSLKEGPIVQGPGFAGKYRNRRSSRRGRTSEHARRVAHSSDRERLARGSELLEMDICGQ